MTTVAELIVGRLSVGRAGLRDRGADGPRPDGPTAYDASRFGLVRESAAAAPPPSPAPTRRRRTHRRGTFRLPARLLHRLKAYAITTGRFQYDVAAECLGLHLAELVARLDWPQRNTVEDLHREYDRLRRLNGGPGAPSPSR